MIADLEFPYCYYAYVVDPQGHVEYLHYGLWEEGTESPKEAQENLARLMQALIPEGVERILDVGCGLGRTTYDLTRAGYSTVGISPDKKNMEMARAKYGSGLQLLTTRFEDYKSPTPFDLVMFQESSNYLSLRALLSQSKTLLRQGGFLLLCDEVRYWHGRTLSFHRKDLLLRLAGAFGLKLLHNRDISDRVLITREYVFKTLTENKEAIIKSFLPFREKVEEELDWILDGWKHDTDLFEKGCFGYEVFLFQKRRIGLFRISSAFLILPHVVTWCMRKVLNRISAKGG